MSAIPYRYGPRRNAAIQRFMRALEFGDRPTLHDAREVASELQQQTHLARQYDRALRSFGAHDDIADLKRRIRLARAMTRDPGANMMSVSDALDLRRPLPRGRR